MAAGTGKLIVGKIASGAFETVGRTESWAEQRTITAHIVGQYSDLDNKVKPGDSMADHAGWFGGKLNGSYHVKTVDLTSPDGVTGELNMSLVICPKGKFEPFNTTWDIGMEEVQMKLINHPDVLKNCDIDVLLKWEATPAAFRVKKEKKKDSEKSELKFYYYNAASDGNGGWQTLPVNGEWNIAYCKAVTQGVTTYNRYMPVITRNTQYLMLPGVTYNEASHQIEGGTLSKFTGANQIGRYNEPPMNISGYDSSAGAWFKSVDKFTSGADGTWTRTESWVFTPDKSAKWIYTGKLGDAGNRIGE